MLYTKNGIFRDSKKFLECADGRTIFNATKEQWEAEGWKIYEPEKTVIREIPIEELRENLKSDAEIFINTICEFSFSREDQVYYRQLAQDLLESGITSARLFLPDDNQEYDLEKVVEFFKELSILEFHSQEILRMHLGNLDKLDTREKLEAYDYTADYPTLPNVRYARKY